MFDIRRMTNDLRFKSFSKHFIDIKDDRGVIMKGCVERLSPPPPGLESGSPKSAGRYFRHTTIIIRLFRLNS